MSNWGEQAGDLSNVATLTWPQSARLRCRNNCAAMQKRNRPRGAESVMEDSQRMPREEPAVSTERAYSPHYLTALSGMVVASHELVVGIQAITAEMLAFWQSRMKEGMVTVQRLLQCSSAEGALEIHLDYAKGALQAYLDQTAKIGAVTAHSLARPRGTERPESKEAIASSG
jgi:hypothetical protein